VREDLALDQLPALPRHHLALCQGDDDLPATIAAAQHQPQHFSVGFTLPTALSLLLA